MAERKQKHSEVKSLVLDINCLCCDDVAVMAENKKKPSLEDKLNNIKRAKIRIIVFSDKNMRDTQKALKDGGANMLADEKNIITREKLVDDGYSSIYQSLAQSAYFPIKTALYFGADGHDVKSAVIAGFMGKRVDCKEIKVALNSIAQYDSGAMIPKERSKNEAAKRKNRKY